MLSKKYKKHIAEGKPILIFSLFFALVMRILYFFIEEPTTEGAIEGYLWQPLQSLFNNTFVSAILSSVSLAIIALLLTRINNKHAFIRQRTLMPTALAILFFSCSPYFTQFVPEYVGAIILLHIVDVLFESYGANQKQVAGAKVGFALSVGSLFVPSLLLYFPIACIALSLARSFNFKALLAMLFGVVVVYVPAFCYFLFLDDLDAFWVPFFGFEIADTAGFPFLYFSIVKWVVLGFAALLLLISLVNGYMNSFKDKIRVRALFAIVSVIVIFSIPLLLLYPIASALALFAILGLLPLLLGHYFALNVSKSTAILFYFSFSIYIFFSILPFVLE